jgi:hypothetical protein
MKAVTVWFALTIWQAANSASVCDNIYIGDTGVSGENNVIAIGSFPAGETDYVSIYIGGSVLNFAS